MADKLEERVEQIVDKKLGLYEPKTDRRRTANEIRDRIQEELEKRPKTEHEISKAVNATRSTVQNHCEHLAELNVAEQIEIEDLRYWKNNSD